MAKSELEELLAFQIKAVGLPDPVREFQFYPGRKYRADFAFIKQKLLVEIDGGIWSKGSHARPRGILRDMEKSNLASLDGWTYLRVSGADVKEGRALELIESAIKIYDEKKEKEDHDS